MKLPKPLDIMIPFDGQLRIVRDKVNEIIYFLSTQNEKEEQKLVNDKSYQQGKEDAVREMYEFAKTAESEIYATRTRLVIKEYAKLNNINL